MITEAIAAENFRRQAVRHAAETEWITVEVDPAVAPMSGSEPAQSPNNAAILSAIGMGASVPAEFRAALSAIVERNREEENALVSD